jgi:hypothetical protein
MNELLYEKRIMNPLDVLGKKFNEVEGAFSNTGVLEAYDVLEEGDEQEYYVSAPDDSWQLLLDPDNTIKTIFLFLGNGYNNFNSITSSTTPSEIVKMHGEPSSKGKTHEIPLIGKVGAWERYEFSEYVLHIEHSMVKGTVEKITLMLPS